MYCKCSSGNNYNVVGVGDVNDYSQKNSPAAWVQITVPEILPLPECYPDIEAIERIYVNVVVDSTRVVKTPVSTTPNTENLTLTGNELVVDASICQTIVYTAADCEQSLHSINFKFPFCACITLPPSTSTSDPAKLKYCVDVLVEDVYAKALNERTICKCVTLFLEPVVVKTNCPQG